MERWEMVDRSDEPLEPPNQTDDEIPEALERYQERRFAEIRSGAPVLGKRFIPLDELKEWADEPAKDGGSVRSG
jgi:hypothetical protein